jgi:hypothetical protein
MSIKREQHNNHEYCKQQSQQGMQWEDAQTHSKAALVHINGTLQ